MLRVLIVLLCLVSSVMRISLHLIGSLVDTKRILTQSSCNPPAYKRTIKMQVVLGDITRIHDSIFHGIIEISPKRLKFLLNIFYLKGLSEMFIESKMIVVFQVADATDLKLQKRFKQCK